MSDDRPKRRWSWPWTRRRKPEPTAEPMLIPAETPPPVPLRPSEELWLEKLVEASAEGERTDEIGGMEFWEHIAELERSGRNRLASEWLTKFLEQLASNPHTEFPRRDELQTEMQIRIASIATELGDTLAAVPHLEALTLHPSHAARAHFELGEHYRRRGDEAPALRHFQAALARDVDYPNADQRIQQLLRHRGAHGQSYEGRTLDGADASASNGSRYTLVHELGRGATGVVYAARDCQLDRQVAIKMLHPHLRVAAGRVACERFFREARLAASLRHPNIIGILDVDEQARRLVMELATGGTLRRVMESDTPLPTIAVFEHHHAIMSALASAHEHGIVHRDVKPANIMFRGDPRTRDSEVMVADFGVAHLPAGEVSDSGVRRAVGTLAYMPPEQRQGGTIDGRVDVYAAAVVLYEMLAGEHPVPRERILRGHIHREDFELPDAIATELLPNVRTILRDHMAEIGDPDPQQRATSAAAAASARRLLDAVIVTAPPGQAA